MDKIKLDISPNLVNGFKYTSLNNKIISDNKSITEVWKILKINEKYFSMLIMIYYFLKKAK